MVPSACCSADLVLPSSLPRPPTLLPSSFELAADAGAQLVELAAQGGDAGLGGARRRLGGVEPLQGWLDRPVLVGPPAAAADHRGTAQQAADQAGPEAAAARPGRAGRCRSRLAGGSHGLAHFVGLGHHVDPSGVSARAGGADGAPRLGGGALGQFLVLDRLDVRRARPTRRPVPNCRTFRCGRYASRAPSGGPSLDFSQRPPPTLAAVGSTRRAGQAGLPRCHDRVPSSPSPFKATQEGILVARIGDADGAEAQPGQFGGHGLAQAGGDHVPRARRSRPAALIASREQGGASAASRAGRRPAGARGSRPRSPAPARPAATAS